MPAVRTSLFSPCLALLLTAGATAHAGAPLPALPGANGQAPPAVAPSGPGPAGESPVSILERVRRGVVMIERDGRLLGFGTVLAGDGRILTALSALTTGDSATVRYADGSSVVAKVGHRDPTWDLALLVPLSAKWKEGLSASEADPGIVELRAPIPLKLGATPIPLPVHYRGKTEVLSRQGEALMNALELELHNALPLAGAPLVDGAGTVAGVIVHECKLAIAPSGTASGAAAGAWKDAMIKEAAKAPCTPTLVGAPVSALRDFLLRTPTNAITPAPWLGIVGQPDATGSVHGVRVMAVAPASPAERGGLHTLPDRDRSDLIVAVDGQPVETPEKLAEALGKHAIGESVKLLVYGVALRPAAPVEAKSGDAKAGSPPAPPADSGDPPAFREVAVGLRASP